MSTPGPFPITANGALLRFAVRVKPRASRSAIGGVREDAVEVSVNAPPVDGAANDEVVRVLAAALGVPRRQVAVVAGEKGRRKVIEVAGLGADDVRQRLGGAP
jgi:uncharacterized protein